MLQELVVPQNVILLERGTEDMLIFNSKQVNPIYIKKGREYIKNFIKAVQEIEIKEKVLEYFPQDKELLNFLIEHLIIIEKNLEKEIHNQTDKDKFFFDPKATQRCNENKHLKIGMSLYLLISQFCNLACVYCLNGRNTYHKEKKLKMSEAVAFAAIEKCLSKLLPTGDLEIVFFGGEPLLNWTLAKKVIMQCENVFRNKFPDRKWHYHITTNLSIFPNDLIQWIKKYNITILCDVDGPEDLHNITRPFINGKGSHSQIIHNIEKLRNAGISISLRSTITSYNVNYISHISEYHKKLGGNGSACVPVNAVTSDEYILPPSMLPDPDLYVKGVLDVFHNGLWEANELFPINTFIERVKGNKKMFHGCGAPYGNTPVVDVYGNVYACIYLVGINKYKIGNIFNGSFPKQEVLDYMLEVLNVNNMENCKNCSWRFLCGGGCPVGRLTVFNNHNASKEVIDYTQIISCKQSKSFIEALLWKYAEEKNKTLLISS